MKLKLSSYQDFSFRKMLQDRSLRIPILLGDGVIQGQCHLHIMMAMSFEFCLTYVIKATALTVSLQNCTGKPPWHHVIHITTIRLSSAINIQHFT